MLFKDLPKRVQYQARYDELKGLIPKGSIPQLTEDKTGWNHPCFEEFIYVIKERNDFMENPPTVEEGIFTCKCGSKKTISIPKHTRSADEPVSVDVRCIMCMKSWLVRG